MRAPTLARLYMVLAAVVFLLQLKTSSHAMYDAAIASGLIVSAYAGCLLSSMIIYRLYFHRIRQFQGPTMAKISKLYHFWNIRNDDQYLFLEHLHLQYGDFVRTGELAHRRYK